MDNKTNSHFKFGRNWKNYLAQVTELNVMEAKKSLCSMLEIQNLEGKSFLDIGSGSGLFSTAAKKLGAKVFSFDFDQESVECTLELKRRFCLNAPDWKIEQGSVLDTDYINSLGRFDIVYSWGVLHHTGQMWRAFDNTISAVSDDGVCFIAIYNDEGSKSKRWKKIKKIYCSGLLGKVIVKLLYIPYFFFRIELNEIVKMRNPFTVFKRYKVNRGMSIYYDWIDWLGGYPFEVAKPEEIFEYFKNKGFLLKKLKTTNGLGLNEFIFQKTPLK